MSGGHAAVDKVLERVKEWFLALTFVDLSFGVLLLLAPRFLGGIFLYTTEALPLQMFGATLLSLGVMMLHIRSFNRSAHRMVLDYKILVAGCMLLAVLVSLFFGDAKWTLIILALIIMAMAGICVYLRRMIPREDAPAEAAHH